MSYPRNLSNPTNAQDLLKRKEFYSSRIDQSYLGKIRVDGAPASTDPVNDSFLDELIAREGNIVLHAHQRFVQNFISPHTPYSRLLLKHMPGTGKTIASLGIARAFIENYKIQHQLSTAIADDPSEATSPTCYIIGFTRHVFQKELLRHPEFGFITKSEIEDHKRLRRIAEFGSKLDKSALVDFETRIKKRITNKRTGGFYKFFGYKEFFNRLFIFSDLSADFGDSANSTDVDETTLMEGFANGTIRMNWDLVESMGNSIVLCDEFHNVFNSLEVNNYGLALGTLFDLFDSPGVFADAVDLVALKTSDGRTMKDFLEQSTIRVVYMSATPINNSPTEIIDLLNLLVPRSVRGKQLTKDEFFIDNRTLQPGALAQIESLIQGRVSFLQDTNPKYFPKTVFEGDPIRIPASHRSPNEYFNTTNIMYLKFIRCPMSPLHLKTYLSVYENTLPPDGQALADLVLPNPGIMSASTELDASSSASSKDLGLFKTRDIRFSLKNASQKWKDKHQIEMVTQTLPGSNVEVDIITGEFMKIGNLGKYSAKDEQIVIDAIDHVRNARGKIMIIHQLVKMAGVLFLGEVLRRNGFIDEFASPTDNTLCSICGTEMKKHSPNKMHLVGGLHLVGGKKEKKGKSASHEFMPVRFIMAHGEIDKSSMDKSIEKFNSPDNPIGHKYMILLGSKMIREAYDFRNVENMWVVSTPPNIASLIQIFGRPTRKNSHVQLPPERRAVHFRIYVSSLDKRRSATDLSYEETRYLEKTRDYMVIQDILRVFNANAIDAIIHRDKIFPHVSMKSKHKSSKSISSTYERGLGALYFEPSDIFGKLRGTVLRTDQLTTSTFNAFHREDEVLDIIFIVKRLFIEQSPVWKYTDLWKTVREPPFETHVSSAHFSEDNFKIALSRLLYLDNRADLYFPLGDRPSDDSPIPPVGNVVDRLFDEQERRIITTGSGSESESGSIEHRIVYVNGFYMLAPMHNMRNDTAYDSGMTVTTDPTALGKASHLGWDVDHVLGKPELVVDMWSRPYTPVSRTIVPVTEHMQASNVTYENMKYKFFLKYKNVPVHALPTSVELYGMEFHLRLIEESVRYAFHVMTNANVQFSELHEFYFKMLYFYNRLDLVLFADHLEGTKAYSEYSRYITAAPAKLRIKRSVGKHKRVEILPEDHKYNAFLMSSVLKSTNSTEPFNIGRLNDLIQKSRASVSSAAPAIKLEKRSHLSDLTITRELKRQTGKVVLTKVFSHMLPVGHFLTSTSGVSVGMASVPKLYIPAEDTWAISTEFVAEHKPTASMVENDIVVGYYEKNLTGIDIKFKIRPPVQKITIHSDSRMIERGAACQTRKKDELTELAGNLGLSELGNTVTDICQAIKLELMDREMRERRKVQHMSPASRKKYKQIRWFYLHFEPQLLES